MYGGTLYEIQYELKFAFVGYMAVEIAFQKKVYPTNHVKIEFPH
jgi:hypothetical protein